MRYDSVEHWNRIERPFWARQKKDPYRVRAQFIAVEQAHGKDVASLSHVALTYSHCLKCLQDKNRQVKRLSRFTKKKDSGRGADSL